MKLFEHVIHLARKVKPGDSQPVRLILTVEDLVQFEIEISLIEQALDAHLAHELYRGLQAESNLFPTP